MEPNGDERFDRGGRTPQRLLRQFGRLIGMTAGQVHKVVHGDLAAIGAHKYHYAVLAALDEFGPASQAGLSDRTGIYKSDLVAAINALEGAGHVRRAPDAEDRRRNVISMTDAGRERLDRLDAVLAAAHDRVLAPLAPAERDHLMDMLRRVNAHLAADSD